MSAYNPEQAAAALLKARQARQLVVPLPLDVAPRTEAEGAAAQHALARQHAAPIAPGGFKIGATARRMQEYLGLSGPAAGFMAIGDVHPSGVTLLFADYVRPGVECELAVRLAHDLPPGPCTPGAGGRGGRRPRRRPSRWWRTATATWPNWARPTLIADQVYHAAAVVGDAAPPTGASWTC